MGVLVLEAQGLREREQWRSLHNDHHHHPRLEALRAAIESVGIEFTGDGVLWGYRRWRRKKRSDHIEAPRLSGQLGWGGGPGDNSEPAAANRARIDGRSAPEPDLLSPASSAPPGGRNRSAGRAMKGNQRPLKLAR